MGLRIIGRIVASLLCACGVAAAADRTWTSSDGRRISGVMLSADETSVRIQRSSDRRQVEIPLAQLSAADREYVAVAGARRFTRLDAIATATDSARRSRVTGRRRVRRKAPNGRVYTRWVNRVEHYSLIGKTVKVAATTSAAPFEARVDVLFISRNGNNQRVYDSRSRTMTIDGTPRPFEVSSQKSEHYYGWAVVVKHKRSGRTIATKTSSHAVEQFVRSRPGS